MKTTKSVTAKSKTSIVSFALIIVSAFLIASCQKEEEQPTASSANNASEMAKGFDHPLPVPTIAFTSIKINHIAARSLNPDYSITIYANGSGVYEGRRNVHIMGVKHFEMDKRTLEYISDLSLRINFFDIRAIDFNIPDLPIVATTFTNSEGTKTLADSEGVPEVLVAFRTKIETALNMSKLVSGDKRFETVNDVD